MTVTLEIVLILALLVVNGVLAMAEIALVASRKNRLRELAASGDLRAGAVLQHSENPTRFLATVQVGITLSGILAGAVGGATLSGELAKVIGSLEGVAPFSQAISVGLVVLILTFLSLVFGELVPKRLGLAAPESISLALVGPLQWLARWTAPVVNGLSALTDGLLRWSGVKTAQEPMVPADEIRSLMEQGRHLGVLRSTEQEMVEAVFQLDQRTAGDLMTPEAQMVFLNIDDPAEINWRKIIGSGHSCYPVYRGSRDQLLGVVAVKAIWANHALAGCEELEPLLTEPVFVPATMPAHRLLAEFKQSGRRIALVADEYGRVCGLITLTDVLEAIVGDLPSKDDPSPVFLRSRGDGSWVCDGRLDVGSLKSLLKVTQIPGEEQFETVAGFVLHQLVRMPQEGDVFDFSGWRFEVLDMDRQRIDKVLVMPGTLVGSGTLTATAPTLS